MTPDTTATEGDGGDTDDDLAEVRERAREAVAVDTSLSPAERETIYRTAQDRDTLDVFTQERGLMNRLLAHTEATVAFVTVDTDDVGGEAIPLEAYDGGDVVGVKAELPVGCLSIAQEPRKHGTHADMITERVLPDGGSPLDDLAGYDRATRAGWTCPECERDVRPWYTGSRVGGFRLRCPECGTEDYHPPGGLPWEGES